MTDLKGGENIVQVTKQPNPDIIGDIEWSYKLVELTDIEKKSSIETEIKKKRLKIT